MHQSSMTPSALYIPCPPSCPSPSDPIPLPTSLPAILRSVSYDSEFLSAYCFQVCEMFIYGICPFYGLLLPGLYLQGKLHREDHVHMPEFSCRGHPSLMETKPEGSRSFSVMGFSDLWFLLLFSMKRTKKVTETRIQWRRK